MTQSKQNSNTSFSSVETQRELRIQRMQELKNLGHNPYTPYSKRDFSLGFIRFWFDFVHKFDLSKVYEDTDLQDLNYLEYFLDLVLFPRTLVEKAEEHLQLRSIVKESGFDPELAVFQEEFSSELINEARDHFPDLSKYDEEVLWGYKKSFLLTDEDSEKIEVSLLENQTVTLAGRIKSKRVSGKIAFATMEDESCPEGFQFIFKKDDLGEEDLPGEALSFGTFKKVVDEGDYIQATGVLDYSQRGEPSLFVKQVRILTKSLRPLPEKIDYENFEYRYLNRVADFKFDTRDESGLSVRDIVRLKAKYWSIWREEMQKEGFLEVECPVFEDIPGGADARPFTTFYNELNQEMYMRIALEIPLKKLIAGGFEKVYEIGRIFRNEGASPQHLQEYTQIEWYWAYTDYRDAMKFIARVYRRIALEINNSLQHKDYYGNDIDWSEWVTEKQCQENGWEYVHGWPSIKYYDAVSYYSEKYYGKKIEMQGLSYDQLLELAKQENIEIDEGLSHANLIDKIYKKVCRPFITNPIFLSHQPVELEPLAKRDPEEPEFVHRWQVVVGTAEMGKAFSELNDPLDQLDRFLEQQKARDNGDEEAQFMNMPYVEAMELGMPPLSGFGVSERMLSFLLGKSIKECVTFPATRRAEEARPKSVCISGSMQFKQKMLEVEAELQKLGFEVYLPDVSEKKDSKTRLIQKHNQNIQAADMLLIVNETRDRVEGKIGVNTLLEMGVANYLQKPIYLLNQISKDLDSYDEVSAIKPVILDGDLSKIKK